jgi:hypothetical protein
VALFESFNLFCMLMQWFLFPIQIYLAFTFIFRQEVAPLLWRQSTFLFRLLSA